MALMDTVGRLAKLGFYFGLGAVAAAFDACGDGSSPGPDGTDARPDDAAGDVATEADAEPDADAEPAVDGAEEADLSAEADAEASAEADADTDVAPEAQDDGDDMWDVVFE